MDPLRSSLMLEEAGKGDCLEEGAGSLYSGVVVKGFPGVSAQKGALEQQQLLCEGWEEGAGLCQELGLMAHPETVKEQAWGLVYSSCPGLRLCQTLSSTLPLLGSLRNQRLELFIREKASLLKC